MKINLIDLNFRQSLEDFESTMHLNFSKDENVFTEPNEKLSKDSSNFKHMKLIDPTDYK